MSASGDEHHLEFLTVEDAGLVLDVALDNRDYPLVINFLVKEVLTYV